MNARVSHPPLEMTVAINTTAEVPGRRGTYVAFRAAHEGRCPTGALCIRADYVIVDLSVTRAPRMSSVSIGAGYSNDGPVAEHAAIDGLKLSYRDLTPRPGISGVPDPSAYRVLLLIEDAR